VRRFVFAPRWVAGHVLVLVAVVSCILLGRWQWGVSQHTHSLQNLAYALQWPLFAVFFLVAWWRMLHLESERLDEEEFDGSADATEPDATAAADTTAGADGADATAGADTTAGIDTATEAEPGRKRRRATPPPVSEPLLYPPVRSAVTARSAASAESRAATGHDEPEHLDRPGSDTDEDEQLAAYNRMLARLSVQDEQR
jgi:DNA-binding transcriptional regulator of glucitol operon